MITKQPRTRQSTASHLEKHKQTVFDNPLAVIFEDEVHSADEMRELIIGHFQRNRILIISFVEGSDAVRIISARLATRRE